MDNPLPVQSLGYATPVAGRPGIITAIGVLSIVVGSLGVLANAGGTLYGFGMFMVAQTSAGMAGMAAPPAGTTTPVVTIPSGGTLVGATTSQPVPLPSTGLAAAQRQTVVAGLSSVRRLNTERLEQLETLLAEIGRAMVPNPTSPQAVAATVTDSGQAAGSGDDYFVLPQGRVVVSDYGAVFGAADGTVTRLALGQITDASGQTTLPIAHVEAIIRQVTSSSGVTLSAAQDTAMRNELRAPGQTLVSPLPTVADVVAQVSGVPDGSGGVVAMGNTGSSLTVSAGGNITARAASPFSGGFPSLHLAPPLIMLLASAAEAILATFLLVIGILVLRQHPRSGRLHAIFAWIKIPLVLISAAAGAWTMQELMSGFMGMAAQGTLSPVTALSNLAIFLIYFVVPAALGLAYPVGLLTALRSRTVREYYAVVRATG